MLQFCNCKNSSIWKVNIFTFGEAGKSTFDLWGNAEEFKKIDFYHFKPTGCTRGTWATDDNFGI